MADGPGSGVVGLMALVLLDSLVDPSPAPRVALDEGCGRMDGNVRSARTTGTALYERLGGVRVADRLSHRPAGPGLSVLADSAG